MPVPPVLPVTAESPAVSDITLENRYSCPILPFLIFLSLVPILMLRTLQERRELDGCRALHANQVGMAGFEY